MKNLLILIVLALTYIVQTNAQGTNAESGFKYKKGYYSLTNHKGKVIRNVEPFTFASPFSEGLALVEKDLKFGYIDSKGTLVIDYEFYNAGSFYSGLAYASIGEKYGYINKKAEFVIPCKFEMANDFVGDYAQVLKTNPDTAKYGYSGWIFGLINKQGELMGDAYFSSISYSTEDDNFKATIKDSIIYISNDGSITQTKSKPAPAPVYYIVEEMPLYPGGVTKLQKYLLDSTRYPISAQINGLQGKVYVQFIVDTDGTVYNVFSIRKEAPILMKEAERVVRGLNNWKPGIQNGKPVKVSFMMPINFVLQ